MPAENKPVEPLPTLAIDAEPKPYPDRLCHIDYTAHPYRCGCLNSDEEAQRRFDEYQRDTKLATAEWAVARLTAERNALQLMLNDLEEQNHSLEQRRHAEQQACQAAERRVKELTSALSDLVRINEQHNHAVGQVLGVPLGWKDSYLDAARAALNPTAEAVSHE